MTDITVSLPDDLAQQARTAGLLRDDAIAELLRQAMRKGQIERLFDDMGKLADKLANLEPKLTEAAIDEEIAAARAERARRR